VGKIDRSHRNMLAYRCRFFGPVVAYIHHEGGEYHAYVDPLYVIGTGRTIEAALMSASDLVETYLRNAAELISKHGRERVRVENPLPEDLKRSAIKEIQGYLYAEARGAVPRQAPIRPEPVNRLMQYLRNGKPRDIGLFCPSAPAKA
jgi:predicted RNase H-like HicB family nuclease